MSWPSSSFESTGSGSMKRPWATSSAASSSRRTRRASACATRNAPDQRQRQRERRWRPARGCGQGRRSRPRRRGRASRRPPRSRLSRRAERLRHLGDRLAVESSPTCSTHSPRVDRLPRQGAVDGGVLLRARVGLRVEQRALSSDAASSVTRASVASPNSPHALVELLLAAGPSPGSAPRSASRTSCAAARRSSSWRCSRFDSSCGTAMK